MLPFPSPATLGPIYPRPDSALAPITCGMLCSYPQHEGFSTLQTVTLPVQTQAQRPQRTYVSYAPKQAEGQVSVDVSFSTRDMC